MPDEQVELFNSCVDELSGLREMFVEQFTPGNVIEPAIRLKVRDLVTSMNTAVCFRKNYPTLVARIPNEVAAWVASLGPCGNLLKDFGLTLSALPCNDTYVQTIRVAESLDVTGVCHDFDVARNAAVAFCSQLGTGSLRQSVLQHLLSLPVDGGETLTSRERGILRLAERLCEKTPATRATMLMTLVDARTDKTIAEQALAAAIATDSADDTAYWNLAQLFANRHEYASAIALVDAGMSHVTSVTEMRRMLKKVKRWAG